LWYGPLAGIRQEDFYGNIAGKMPALQGRSRIIGLIVATSFGDILKEIALDSRRIKITVQYDGAQYLGWQFQSQGPTVQQALEAALSKMMDRPVRAFSAGRTDTGVHAAAMPVHFDTDHPIPAERLPAAMGRFLPRDISILAAEDAAPDFDARRGALLRWYRYQILMARFPRPLGPRAWHVYRPLDLDAMEQGIALLNGDHDFRGFRSSQCQAKRTRLTMQEASMTRAGEVIALDFKCRSFLHHMIRFMAGTLVAMGLGSIDRERLLAIRDAGERPKLIYCAPPEGLCLMGVAYTEQEREAMRAAHPAPPSF
jgi:tRNA pseudouridine38-40 synthase